MQSIATELIYFMLTQHQSSMREYSSCLATRGLIFNGRPGGNSSSVGRGWRPLHKPQWFDVNRKVIIYYSSYQLFIFNYYLTC